MNLDREIKLFGFNLWYAEQLVKDIPANQFTHQPIEKVNPPAWILGHLTITTDYGLQLLGQPQGCSERWHQLFSPGTPNQPAEAYPIKEELWSGFYAAHQRLETAAKNASAKTLEAPNPLPYKLLTQNFPTIGDQVAHLMTVHESMHLGQLSAWRRMMGMPGVLNL
jgi:hypothetical protein